MKRYIVIFLLALFVIACKPYSEQDEILTQVENLMENNPDSALIVLNSINKEELTTKKLKAKYEYLNWHWALLTSSSIPDIESTESAYNYYTNSDLSTQRFHCHLYRGIYYLDKNDCIGAMQEFSKAEKDYAHVPLKYQGMLHTYKAYVYRSYFDFQGELSELQHATEKYLEAGILNKYTKSIVDIIDCYIMMNDTTNSRKYIDVAEKYLKHASIVDLHNFYSSKAKYLLETGTPDDVVKYLDDYLCTNPNDAHANWRILAHLYISVDEPEKALFCITKEAEYRDISNDQNYHIVLAHIQKSLKEYDNAIDNYEKCIHLDDSLELISLDKHIRMLEERHANELSRIEAENTQKMTILVCIIVVLSAVIVIYIVYRQLQIRTTEKRLLEYEKQRYEQLYADAIAERDTLTKMIEEVNIKDETKAIIKQRLDILNKVVISYITDTTTANKKAYQELEALVADRDKFIESTRITIEANNPEFIAILKKQGLTDDEINVCCLYIIGLKGKDIKTYTSRPRHYNQSADIRHKLGLTENDTNLSIYLKRLLEQHTCKTL